MPSDIFPQVDDKFWFDYSKEWVQNSLQRRDEAAAKLQTLIGWFWSTYTGATAVGFALGKLDFPIKTTLLIASPIPVLIVGYMLCTLVQMPISTEFDSSSPSDIRESYNHAVQGKDKRLRRAMALSVISAVLVALALVEASVARKPAELQSQPLAARCAHEGNKNILVFSGTFPKNAKVVCHVLAGDEAAKDKNEQTIIRYAPESGNLSASEVLSTPDKAYRVVFEWKLPDGSINSVSKTLKFEDQ